MRARTRATVIVAALALALTACGGGDDGDDETAAADDDAAATTTTTPTPTTTPEPLRLLVTNDDGYDAEGIDALVEGLLALDQVEVTVFAPLENQSGTSDNSNPGTDEPTTEATTASGHPATTVDGFPADSVEQGLAAMAEPPHLVVSGINEGQNIGPFVDLSGTVGAARTAARAGIPALGVSQGTFDDGPEPNYPDAVDLAVEWVVEHRDELVSAEPVEGVAEVTNLNVPTCRRGALREPVEAAVATSDQVGGQDLFDTDCTVEVTDPAHDVEAFLAGHPVFSELTA